MACHQRLRPGLRSPTVAAARADGDRRQAGARFARRRGPRWRDRHRGRHRRPERLDDRIACRGDPELSPWRQDLAAPTSNLPTVVGGSRKAGLVRALIALATVTGGIAIPHAVGAAADCAAWSSHYVRDENQHSGSTGWRDAKPVTSTSAQLWLDHDS